MFSKLGVKGAEDLEVLLSHPMTPKLSLINDPEHCQKSRKFVFPLPS